MIVGIHMTLAKTKIFIFHSLYTVNFQFQTSPRHRAAISHIAKAFFSIHIH